jgi:hypothetical protein
VELSFQLVAGQKEVSPVVKLLTYSLSTGVYYSISSVRDETVIPLWLGRQSLVCIRAGCEKVRLAVELKRLYSSHLHSFITP